MSNLIARCAVGPVGRGCLRKDDGFVGRDGWDKTPVGVLVVMNMGLGMLRVEMAVGLVD